jgi:predicted transcriptional regulator
MKKLLLFTAMLFMAAAIQAQGLRGVLKDATKKDSSGRTGIDKVRGKSGSGSLTSDEIISGLKEALSVGSHNASQKLSAADGFFKDAALKILMPEEAKKVESRLRTMGMGRQVDNAILSMNRAAEDASKEIAPIFVAAIRQMSIQDGIGILRGGDFAATDYLKGRTVNSLTESFRPIIENSLKKVDATKHWNTLFTTYNQLSAEKVNPDLTAYVTERALAGVFHQVGLEEQKIRKDPMARTSDMLKKVFGQ